MDGSTAYDDAVDRLFTSIIINRELKSQFANYLRSPNRYVHWTCKDGTTIPIKDMSLQHLRNAISLVERKDPDNIWLDLLRYELYFREKNDEVANALQAEEMTADLCI